MSVRQIDQECKGLLKRGLAHLSTQRPDGCCFFNIANKLARPLARPLLGVGPHQQEFIIETSDGDTLPQFTDKFRTDAADFSFGNSPGLADFYNDVSGNGEWAVLVKRWREVR